MFCVNSFSYQMGNLSIKRLLVNEKMWRYLASQQIASVRHKGLPLLDIKHMTQRKKQLETRVLDQ